MQDGRMRPTEVNGMDRFYEIKIIKLMWATYMVVSARSTKIMLK
jgi:hypothetical protein